MTAGATARPAEAPASSAFSIDTSALLDGSKRWYPFDHFPSFWAKMDEIVEDGSLIAIDEVFKELERQKGDPIHQWCKDRKKMFQPLTEDVQKASAEVIAKFPGLTEEKRDRGRADPFVVGLARVTKTVVVTGETMTTSKTKVKIPHACEHFKVRYISLPDLIRELRWRF